MKPRRIQLKRTRGWRMPPNTCKVDRTTRWGNPFRVGDDARHPLTGATVHVDTANAVELFNLLVGSPSGAHIADAARRDLRGKNLACWCREGRPCHGDVLLRVSNSPALREPQPTEVAAIV